MTTRLHRAGVVLVVSAGLCLVAALLLPSAVAARSGLVQVAVNGEAFTSTPTQPLLDVNGLVPGRSSTGRFGVRSGLASAGSLRLRLIEPHDDDNGCAPPEALVDKSCGTGGGELASALVVGVDVAATPTAAATRVWTGTAAQLERGVDTLVGVPAGGQRWVTVTATLPGSVGNAVQSDTLSFRTRIELATTAGVAGVTTNRPGTHSSGTAGLAVTGSSRVALVVAAALLVAGLAALLAGSRRRVSPAR